MSSIAYNRDGFVFIGLSNNKVIQTGKKNHYSLEVNHGVENCNGI